MDPPSSAAGVGGDGGTVTDGVGPGKGLRLRDNSLTGEIRRRTLGQDKGLFGL